MSPVTLQQIQLLTSTEAEPSETPATQPAAPQELFPSRFDPIGKADPIKVAGLGGPIRGSQASAGSTSPQDPVAQAEKLLVGYRSASSAYGTQASTPGPMSAQFASVANDLAAKAAAQQVVVDGLRAQMTGSPAVAAAPAATPATYFSTSVNVNGQSLSFTDPTAMSQYWEANFNKPNLSPADQAASSAFLDSYYAGLKTASAAQSQANAVDPSTMSVNILPLDPSLVQTAQQMLANYDTLAVAGRNGSQIPNSVYDGQDSASLLQVFQGNGTASYQPRQPWDPSKGPITMDMVTPQMLIEPFQPALLQNMADPAAFLNMRAALLMTPSPAQVMNASTGQSTGGLNPASLSNLDQAQALQTWMADNGLTGNLSDPELGGMFYVQWNGETRRHYQVGNDNTGLVLQELATESVPQVLAQLQAQSDGSTGSG